MRRIGKDGVEFSAENLGIRRVLDEFTRHFPAGNDIRQTDKGDLDQMAGNGIGHGCDPVNQQQRRADQGDLQGHRP